MAVQTRGALWVAGQKPTEAEWNLDLNKLFTLQSGNIDKDNCKTTGATGLLTIATAQSITARKTLTGGMILDELVSVTASGAGDIQVTEIRWDPASGTMTDADGMYVSWMGDDDAATPGEVEYGRQHLEFVDVSAGTEDSSWVFSTIVAGSLTTSLTLTGTAAVFPGSAALSGTLTVGVDDTGYDVLFYGASAGAFMHWDESEDRLDIRGATAAGAGTLRLTTGELTVVDGNVLGRIDFLAPLESDGTDAIALAASIYAEADDTFAVDNNDTDLVFAVAESEAAAERMRLSWDGTTTALTFGNPLNLAVTGDITLTPTATNDINIPANIGLTFGNDGEKIEGDGTDLTIASSGVMNVNATGVLTVTAAGGSTVTIATGGGFDINMGAASGDDFTIDTSAFVVEGDTGNVGIGTTSPDTKLHIMTTDASVGAPNAAADELVLENNGNAGLTIMSPDADGVNPIGWGAPSNTLYNYIYSSYNSGSPYMVFVVNSVARMRMDDSGGVFINDTTNANMTIGVTINQGANDDSILAFKSSDVSCPWTSVTENDTYGSMAKADASAGGLGIQGWKDADGTAGNALVLSGYLAEAGDTTRTTGAIGYIHLSGITTNGGVSVQAPGADENLVVVQAGSVTRFILDSDGDSHQDVGTAWTNFDDQDDALLIRDVAIYMDKKSAIKSRFDDWGRNHEESLIQNGLIPRLTPEQKAANERPLMNMTQLARAQVGLGWQNSVGIKELREIVEEQHKEIVELKTELKRLAA